MSGKSHLSGNHFQNATWPYDKGFEQSLTLLNGGANHFNDFSEIPLEKITFAENDQGIDVTRTIESQIVYDLADTVAK
ncbi:MAG TPA: hypothetical protein VJ767_02420 [Nitrososphaeraceae archaeon]|nr:hypothetical protein [Nitrososphaeraceae archaeon]